MQTSYGKYRVQRCSGLAGLALNHVLTAGKAEWQVEQYDQVWKKDVLAAGKGIGMLGG